VVARVNESACSDLNVVKQSDQKTQFSSSMKRFLFNGNFQFYLMLKSLD
jgi:hypothetical protein